MSVVYPPNDQIHVFSSHAWKHGYRRDDLHRLLQPEWTKGVDYQDRSITWRHPLNTETDPELAWQLRDIIAGCDALLIMAGMYANNSEWMQFEIDAAFTLGIPIIPIVANGQVRVPRSPTRLASCEPVRWRGDSIRQAVWNVLPDYRRQAFNERRQREYQAARERVNYLSRFAPPPPLPNVFGSLDANPPPRRLGSNALADMLQPTPLPRRRVGDNALADMLDQIYQDPRRK